MSTTLNLPSVRFTAQVNTGAPEAKANYKALAQRNALALEGCPWREASGEAVKPSLVEHDFTATFANDKYDAFCMTGSYNSETNTEIAYAGMVAYRFRLPQDYLTGSATLVSASVMLARDRFLLPGLRVSAVLSDSAVPSTDWSVVRGDAEGCVKLSAQLANPANRITAAEQATGAVSVNLAGTDATKRDYLWIYLTVEDYQATWTWYSSTQHRLYAIEGSGMIISQTTTVEFSDDVEPDANPTTLKLLNLATGATDATLTLSGPVFSMVPVFLTGDASPNRFAVITGDFDEYSVPGMPGFVIYNSGSRQIVQVTETSGHEIPAAVKAAWRRKGVRARWSPIWGVRMEFDYVPASASAKVRLAFTKSENDFKVSYEGTADVDFTPSVEAVDRYVPVDGVSAMRFYRDRIAVSELEDLSASWGNAWATNQIALTGSVTSVAASFYGFVIVAGNNEIAGNKSAVKIVTTGGDVVDYFVDLTPDDYTDFAAYEFSPKDAGGVGVYYDDKTVPGNFSDNRFTTESAGYRLVTVDGKTDPQTIKFAGTSAPRFPIEGFALLLTGRFRSIGGVRANGAAILTYCRASTADDCQLALHPLDVGPVKHGVIFCAANSQMPNNASHMLIEPVS